MKLTNSFRYYTYISLLLLSYQFGMRFIFSLTIISQLPDVWYYLFVTGVVACHGVVAGYLLWYHQHLLAIRKVTFSWLSLMYSMLAFVLLFLWASFTPLIFPITQNAQAIREGFQELTGFAFFIQMVFYPIVVAPISEELVYRGLVMSSFQKFQSYRLDMLISSSLFSCIHIHSLQNGWVITDFIYYFVMGFILSWLYRKTNSVWYTIGVHFAWNALLTILNIFIRK
ncbi:CPBP family intramembrane glutamic endopeptidase [Streptococcus constellatus]|nr:type II CAAX endopeptidase family protein [Streptococcus constellatus]